MIQYTVKFYEGDYIERQEAANKDKAICYVEQHLNSKEYDNPGMEDNPILTVVAHNASEKSKGWAAWYSECVYQAFGRKIPKFQGHLEGVLQRQYRERGDYNLRFTKMPAILPEPLWVSEPEHVKMLFDGGTKKLGLHLADSIRAMFPEGGLVAFSVGHLGKKSQPYDRGAQVVGYDYKQCNEALICREILRLAAHSLTAETSILDVKILESDAKLSNIEFLAQLFLRQNTRYRSGLTPPLSESECERLKKIVSG